MKRYLFMAILPFVLGGCPGGNPLTNPFLTFTEQFGAGTLGQTVTQPSGTGDEVERAFRRRITLQLANNHPEFDLDVSFAAWVLPSSIRTAEQQDALLRDGFNQIGRELRIGDVFVLPPGTFIRNGNGLAGSENLLISSAAAADDAGGDDGAAPPVTATEREFSFVTPDVLLVFTTAPTSCDDIAFRFTSGGFPIDSPPAPGRNTFENSDQGGGLKTYRQIDAYQCQPLRPGLFLKRGGGARADNEFFEGETIRFDFSPVSDAEDNFAFVTFEAN